jgi:spore coat protein CotH
VKDATVLEVSKLWLGINSYLDIELFAVFSSNFDLLSNLEFSAVNWDVESLFSSKTKALSVLSWEEL